MIAIAAVVVIANLFYLLDFTDANPLGPRSGMATVAAGYTGVEPAIDPNVGLVSQALGHRAMLDLVHLHLPWWNPYEGTGAPLAGEMQSAALFPPTLLTLISNGQLYEHMLLELLAGISTFLLLRRLWLGCWASLAGAVAFALNGTFAWLGHATVNPVAFLPLLLLGIEHCRVATLADRGGGWRLIALAGALSFYGGFPEVAYIDTMFAILWFAWRARGLERSRRRPFVIKATIGALVGVLLSAPLMIAGLDYLGHADLGPHTTALLGSVRLPSQALPQLLMPYVYGPIFDFHDPNGILNGVWGGDGGYVTVALLMFGVLGVLSRGRRGLRAVLAAWVVLSFARMYGQVPLLGAVLGTLPGMAHLEFFRYATASLELAVIVLAALGVDDVIRFPERRRRVSCVAVGLLVVVAAGAVGAHSFGLQLGSRYARDHFLAASIGWATLSVIVATAAALWLRNARVRGGVLAMVLAVDSLVMFIAPQLSAPRSVQLDGAPVAFLQRHLNTGRVFTLGPLQPNYGSYFGIRTLNINDIPIPSRFASYVRAHLDSHVDPTVFVGTSEGGRSQFVRSPQQELLRNLSGYRAAGVAYILTPASQALPQSPDALTLVARTPTTWIYHLAGAAPLFSADDPRCAITVRTGTSATVRCPSSAQIVYRETAMPGWSATINGSSAHVQDAGLFQSVRLPPGQHAISFGYSPPWIVWGWFGFLTGVAALALAPVQKKLGHHQRPPLRD